MLEQAPGQTQAPPLEQEGGSRLAAVARMTKRAAGWSAPVVGAALKQETGADAYDFVGAQQPELSESQQFGSGVVRFAMRRAAERLAERAATA